MPFRHPHPHGTAEVEKVGDEAIQVEGGAEILDDVGEPVEGEVEVGTDHGVAEPRVVEGDHAMPVTQGVKESAELVGGGREAVQEQNCGAWREDWHGLAVEHPCRTQVEMPVRDFRYVHVCSW